MLVLLENVLSSTPIA